MSETQSVWSDMYYIPTYEVDLKGNVTIPMLGRFMQESAANHASHLGAGYSQMTANNRIWMLLGLAFRIEQYPKWRDTVEVFTWPSRHERIYYYRDFRMVCEGKIVGIATSRWIPVDVKTRRPFRGDMHYTVNWDETERLWPDALQKLPEVESEKTILSTHVRYLDLDVNGHVNNIRYMEWILDGFSLDYHRNHQMREFEIHYKAEAVYGDTVQLVQVNDGEGIYQHVLIRQSDRKELCQARSVWE